MTDPTQQNATPANDAFDALAADAAALEGVAAPGGDVAAAPGGNVAEEAAELVELAASIALPFLPDRYARCFGQRELDRITAALAKLAEKRQWSMSGLMGTYGPEIAFGVAVLGPVLPVLMEEAKAAKAPPVPKPATVVPGPAPAPALEPDQADQVARDGRVL